MDIGCGNGKMLGYLQERTRAHIYGFDYSETAITTAKALFCKMPNLEKVSSVK